MATSFINNAWNDLVDISKNADWPMVSGVVFLVLVIGLTIVMTLRHNARDRILSRTGEDHFTSKHLPVTYLSEAGELKDMFLTPSQFFVFGIFNNEVASMRHGMCTDDPGWSHFCLLAAAEAYQRMTADGQFGAKAAEEDTLDRLIASSINDISEPYIRFIYSTKTDVSPQEVEDALAVARTTARGAKGLSPLGDISSRNISIVRYM